MRLAIIGPAGSGKSSTARELRTDLQRLGTSVRVLKLASPLYHLQRQFYEVAGRPLSADAQNQLLMEAIATHLRAISPTALVDSFTRQLASVAEDVILNDDLRDDKVDWPILRGLGFRIIRVVCSQSVRARRLAGRGDPNFNFHSPLDEQIARIPADYVLTNDRDGLEHLQEQVAALAEHLLQEQGGQRSVPAATPRKGNQQVLTTGRIDFGFDIGEGCEAIADKLLRQLSPAIRPGGANEPTLGFALRRHDRLDEGTVRAARQPFHLRRSSSPPFNLNLVTGTDDQGRLVAADPDTGTAYVCDRERRQMTLYVSDGSHYHLLESIRYTLLAAEQAAGTIVMHASAALGERGAVLVLGDKGRGKTTTMLSLLTQNGLSYFSGDKVLVDKVDGRLRLRGWPDYPHIGVGTLRRFPTISEACGLDLGASGEGALADSDKLLIEPDVFAHAIGGMPAFETRRCHAVVFPDVRTDTQHIEPVEDTTARRALIDGAIEDTRGFTPGMWHGLVPSVAPASEDLATLLADAGWYLANGKNLDLSLIL